MLFAALAWLVAAMIFLRSIWKPERIVDDRPSRSDGFRTRHPVLGAEVRIGRTGAAVVGVLAAGTAVLGWLSLDGWGRYVWAVVLIVAAVGFLVARWLDV